MRIPTPPQIVKAGDTKHVESGHEQVLYSKQSPQTPLSSQTHMVSSNAQIQQTQRHLLLILRLRLRLFSLLLNLLGHKHLVILKALLNVHLELDHVVEHPLNLRV